MSFPAPAVVRRPDASTRALDPDHPGLESVGEAMSAGDLGEAKQRLIAYFRNRRDAGTEPVSPGPTDQPEVTSERGEQLCRELAARDWLSVADPGATPERLYSTQVMMQNDHGEFLALAQEYGETGNHRYASSSRSPSTAGIRSG